MQRKTSNTVKVPLSLPGTSVMTSIPQTGTAGAHLIGTRTWPLQEAQTLFKYGAVSFQCLGFPIRRDARGPCSASPARLKIPQGGQMALSHKDEPTGDKPPLMSDNDLYVARERNNDRSDGVAMRDRDPCQG
ncbi:hypothetical protein QBC46DRAFT_417497 [Diplogelasinospora grovesii]|uniref:Uncharacterized protein n=1 Tax=Diplogelasinospora grovesii TaxID=303347 RepID=A0AAN6N0J4_9PEZI|nr:hypothetical protein QBC46DRAFT_417497 [Diplogelasinospora grovesii]